MKKILFAFIIPVQLCLVNLPVEGQTQNCYTKQAPKGFNIRGISFSTAHQMASLYDSKQANYITKQTINFAETRSVWFSLDKLKSFIAEIEKNVCDSQCTAGKLDLGVRIYFGDYPDSNYMKNKGNEDYDSVKRTYGKHQTVFFVPTYMDNDRRAQIDFDPRDMGNLTAQKCKPKPLKLADPVDVGDNGSSSNNRKRSPAPGTIAPETRKLLILSTAEPQYFISQFKKTETKNAKGGPQTPNSTTSIVNHGNSIPPDPEEGTSF